MTELEYACGDPISIRCTTCRKITAHAVLKVAGGVPTRARCEVCGRERVCRPSVSVRRNAMTQGALSKEWEDQVARINPARTTEYSMLASCKTKALIEHPTFGLGVVERLVGSQKMEVLFADGRKIMRCK